MPRQNSTLPSGSPRDRYLKPGEAGTATVISPCTGKRFQRAGGRLLRHGDAPRVLRMLAFTTGRRRRARRAGSGEAIILGSVPTILETGCASGPGYVRAKALVHSGCE